MNAKAVPSETSSIEIPVTANERFKRSFGNWFWGSMIAATAVHFMVFALFPELTADDYSYESETMETLNLPPEIEIPPPPEQIARPATPVVSTTTIDEDITIASTDFDDISVAELPPPPTTTGNSGVSDTPSYTPMTVQPRILNSDRIRQLMEQRYPPTLRDAGIGGTVEVWFLVDTNGRIKQTEISQSSGQPLLDRAALDVADEYEFSPARNREEIVEVWVTFPIVFQVGGGR